MKTKTLVLLALLCGSWMSHAQDTVQPRYQSVFGDSNTVWFNYYEYIDVEGIGTDARQSLPNDTISIDGNVYNVLRTIGNMSRGYHPYTHPYSFNETLEYLRESEDHSKLYFKGSFVDLVFPEVLIMDLDLNVGDTLDTHDWSEIYKEYSYDTRTNPIITIDTIYYRDGKKILRTNYRKMTDRNGWDTLLFIEGVGPSFGPYYAGYEDRMSLICYYRDGEHLYRGITYGTDSAYTLNPCIRVYRYCIIKQSEDLAATIYPNPVHDAFEIALPAAATYNVAITTLTGCVLQTETVTGDKLHVDIQHYPNGVYLLSVVDHNKNKATMKIVKL